MEHSPGPGVIGPAACWAGGLFDWETLLWPLSTPPARTSLEEWLILPDSLMGWGRADLNYHPLYLRWQGNQEESKVAYTEPSFSSQLRLKRFPWQGGLAVGGGQYSLVLELPTISPQENRLAWGDEEAAVSLFVGRQLPFFDQSRWILGSGWGRLSDVGDPWWAGTALLPHPGWAFTYEHRCDFHYFTLDYFYEDENIHLPLSFKTVGDRALVSGQIASALKWHAELTSCALSSPWEDLSDVERVFRPQGGFVTQTYGVELNLKRYGSLFSAHRQDCIKSQGYFYDEGQSFGKITRGDLFLSLFDLGWRKPVLKKSLLTLLYRYLILKGYVRGHLEFWPFTPTLVDLLGLRRYYDGRLEAQTHGLQGLVEHLQIGPLEAKIGLAAWYLKPQGEFSHWRPVFLVFGKEDERITELEVMEAWLAGLTLGLDYRISRWRLSCLARQLVPIRVVKREVVEVAPPEPAVPAPKEKVYGGGFLKISVTYFF